MTRSPVRADHVERPMGISHSLGIQFERFVVVDIVDQADEVAGNHSAIREDYDLRALGLIIGNEAEPRKARCRCAGDAADVLRLLAVGIGRIHGFAEEFAAHFPGLVRPGRAH